jgi:hypothetical protein
MDAVLYFFLLSFQFFLKSGVYLTISEELSTGLCKLRTGNISLSEIVVHFNLRLMKLKIYWKQFKFLIELGSMNPYIFNQLIYFIYWIYDAEYKSLKMLLLLWFARSQ